MREKFVDKKFGSDSLYIIETANDILEEYREMGYILTLRQLYYQFVARDLFPEERKWVEIKGKWTMHPDGTKNAPPNYKWLGDKVGDGRMSGLIDWNLIEDRGREAVIPPAWSSPADIVRVAANQFRVNRWEGQPCYVEVMVEKDALSGILEPVCNELHVRFTANKGYSSLSAMRDAGRRFQEASDDGKEVHVFYLGDHDPSGIDMTEDISGRLKTFTYGAVDTVHRLALNMDQVKKWNPPENPAKEKDSRYEKYARMFGTSSWELDAVEPRTLASLVRKGIEKLIDNDIWDEVAEKETRMRDELLGFARDYEEREEE